MIGNNVKDDGEDDGATKNAQQWKCENENKEKKKANMIGYDKNRLTIEEQAQQLHVIQNNNDNDNKVTPTVIRDNGNNKVTLDITNAYESYMTHVVKIKNNKNN